MGGFCFILPSGPGDTHTPHRLKQLGVGGVPPVEGVEQPGQLLRRYARAVVGEGQLRTLPRRPGGNSHADVLPPAVFPAVVQQIGRYSGQQRPVHHPLHVPLLGLDGPQIPAPGVLVPGHPVQQGLGIGPDRGHGAFQVVGHAHDQLLSALLALLLLQGDPQPGQIDPVQQHDPLGRVVVDGPHDGEGPIEFLQVRELLLRQAHGQGPRRVIQIAGLGGPHDGGRHPSGPLPGQGDLLHLRPVLVRQLRHPGHDGHVLLLRPVILAHGHPVRPAAQGVRRPGPPGEVSRRQGAVGHQAHAHLFADGDQLPLVLPVEQVIVVLHGLEPGPAVVPGDELHVVKLIAIHGRGSQGPDLARLHQVVQGLHGLLHGGVIVKAVDDVQVQIVGAQAL